MTRRVLMSLAAASLAVAVAAVLTVPVAGQTQKPATTAAGAQPAAKPAPAKPAARAFTPPKTSWGDPDLQGIWNFATSTPLERPAAVGEKAVLSDQEAEQFEEQLAFNLTRDRRDGGNAADVARAYNEHWMDPRRLAILEDKRTSLIVDPANGRIPPRVPFSPERQQAARAVAAAVARFNAGMPATYHEFTAPVRGIIRTDLPPYLGTIYNNTAQIFQSPGYVVIVQEMIHSARIVPMDGRPHINETLRQWLGDTRGRWEGNTLVLETRNFRRDRGAVYGNANPDSFRIVERFTRTGADALAYEFTISDSTTWERPWTAMVPWARIKEQLYEYTTHEDNFDLVHLLQGARVREARGEKAPEPTGRPAAGGDGDR
ncbi:MAG: hypothetical protein HYU37_02800 [Acidobacteria bacterium]|nr:hypothetical protein [Acidobacteriota bacterium]